MVLRKSYLLLLLLLAGVSMRAQMKDDRKQGEIIQEGMSYLKALEKARGNELQYADRLFELGIYCRNAGLYDQAMIAASVSLPMFAKEYKEASNETMANLKNIFSLKSEDIARNQRGVERYDNALKRVADGIALAAEMATYHKGFEEEVVSFYSGALKYYKMLKEKAGPEYIKTLTQSGTYYLNNGQTDKAQDAFLKAIDADDKRKVLSEDEKSDLKSKLACVYLKREQNKKAKAIVEKLKRADQAPSASVLCAFANMALVEKQDVAASQYVEQAFSDPRLSQLSQFSSLYSTPFLSDILSVFGYTASLFEQNNQLEEALNTYNNMKKLLSRNVGSYTPYYMEYERTYLWTIMGPWFEGMQTFAYKHHAKPGMKELLYENTQLKKKLFLVSSAQLPEDADIQKDKLVLLLRQKSDSLMNRAMLSIQDMESDYVLKITEDVKLADMSCELMRHISRKSKTNYKWSSEWQQTRASLRANEASVDFMTVKSPQDGSILYCAIVLKQDMPSPALVSLCSETVLKAIMSRPEKQRDAMLYQTIWKPLGTYLQQASTVYIAPEGLLNAVSFAALQEDGQYLSKTHALRYLLRTEEISELKKKDDLQMLENGKTPKMKDIFLFGDADFGLPAKLLNKDATRGQGFAYLPGSKLEINEISKCLTKGWNVHPFTGRNATEAAFKSICSRQTRPMVIHISTHGFYLPYSEESKGKGINQDGYSGYYDPMFRTGFALSGANAAWKPDSPLNKPNDGVLTAYEILGLHLEKAELVVLSACNTGVGDIHDGEGVYGLQRAFRFAGAKSMIVSLWEVPDKETAELMKNFYQLWQAGKTHQQAFMQAQRNMMNKYPDEPRKWAGFVMIE